MRILICSDSYLGEEVFRSAFADLASVHHLSYVQMDENRRMLPASPSERRIREYLGHPGQIAESLDRHDVLIVHGAPVTDAVLDAYPDLRLIGCARGGLVNVDVVAAMQCNLPVVMTPGRNADSVADLTMAFLLMVSRGIQQAQQRLAVNGSLSDSAYDGREFFGRELRGQTLGLVGFGRVAERVAPRAAALGMRLLAFDPYREIPGNSQAAAIGRLEDLLATSGFVSLHARATADNENMLDAAAFEHMRRGSLLIKHGQSDTGRGDFAVPGVGQRASGRRRARRIQSHPPDQPSPMLSMRQVIMTPHIGGATHETLSRGAVMLAAEVRRFAAGEHVVNVAESRQPQPPAADTPSARAGRPE